ncbi:MAG: hypothetical protein QOE45_1972 [Frankiaceae bacterium]|jgi:hypothetical protein|nr:hypothetical protein [Frankiaceae bacterium]
MRIRLALLTLATAAVSAVPASATAATTQVCAVHLVNVAAGTPTSCSTKGPGPLGNRDVAVRRTMTVEVLAGAVDATLTCGTEVRSLHVSGPVPQFASAWDSACTVALVAAEPNTTAVATSTFSFVITLE